MVSSPKYTLQFFGKKLSLCTSFAIWTSLGRVVPEVIADCVFSPEGIRAYNYHLAGSN